MFWMSIISGQDNHLKGEIFNNDNITTDSISCQVKNLFSNLSKDLDDLWSDVPPIYMENIDSAMIDSARIDLSEFINIQINDLPEMRPTFRNRYFDGYGITVDYHRDLIGYMNIYHCTFAKYNGIKYYMLVKLKDCMFSKEGPVMGVATNDSNFNCFGLHVGDRINDNFVRFNGKERDYLVKIDSTNNWMAKIDDIESQRIVEFIRLPKEGLLIDSVMESNRFPAERQ